jgi:hypothetical protein
MKVMVLNYCGTVGKTTAAAHFFAPRIPGAKVFAVETINETAADLGIETDKLKGGNFGALFKELMTMDSAVIDVGASNVEDMLGRMAAFSDSHEEIDYFVVPVTSGAKEQKETLKTIHALQGLGIDSNRIRVLFNRVDTDPEEEFPAIFGYAAQSGACVVNAKAAIFENEVFDMLSTKRTTIAAVLEDGTDYRQKLRDGRGNATDDEISHWSEMHAIKSLAKGAERQLNVAFAALFQ